MPKTKSLAAAVASARASFALGVVFPLMLIWAYKPLVSEAIEETRAEPAAPEAEDE